MVHEDDAQMALADLELADQLIKAADGVAASRRELAAATEQFNWPPYSYTEIDDIFAGLTDEECDSEFMSELLADRLRMQRQMAEEYGYSEYRAYVNDNRTY